MDRSVIVLLSTYNGQQYLKEQIDSIYAQSYDGHITVLVRDDGSSDETVPILEAYIQTANREVRVIKGSNMGPQRSFLELIRLAPDADYYFFADQDDVWDTDKVSIAVAAMKSDNGPACYCSNFRLSDMELAVYREQALEKEPKFTPLQILFYNKIPGCVMGFNYALMALLKQLELDSVMMHDSMALSLAAACGQVIYDPESRITHRIHQSNVVGDGHKKIVLHKWIPEKLRLLFAKEDYDLSVMAEQFVEAAGEQIHDQYREDILLLRDFKKSRSNTHRLLKHPDTQGRALDRTVMSIRCKIFFHIF